MINDYKKYIIDYINKIDDVVFLRQIYTIIARHLRKEGRYGL